MRDIRKLLLIAMVVAVAAGLSGCCCCYGMDGFTSKYKSSVEGVQFPSTLDVGGMSLAKTKSVYYATKDDCRNAVLAGLAEEGVEASSGAEGLDSALTAAGALEGRSFEYSDASGTKHVGGFVGRSDSPGKLAATYLAGKNALPQFSGVSMTGTYDAGDEADRLETDLYHKYAYIAVCRDSNLFVYAVSFDSASDAEAAVHMAIGACGTAA